MEIGLGHCFSTLFNCFLGRFDISVFDILPNDSYGLTLVAKNWEIFSKF